MPRGVLLYKLSQKQRKREFHMYIFQHIYIKKKAPKGLWLTYTNIPESWVFDTIVVVATFECAVNIATELLCLEHCRKWVVNGSTDEDFHCGIIVRYSTECPLIAVSE